MNATSKRDLLVEAAASRFHRFGVAASSIAEIANDAGVPPGNVYYYFRTKDALAAAVQEYWEQRTSDALADIDGVRDPALRILEFLDRSERNAPIYAQSGCPLAALSRDFRNGGPALQPLAGRIFQKQAEWLCAQLTQLGVAKKEQESASFAILASIQGGIGLAHAANAEDPFRAAIADARQRVTALATA